MCGQGTGGGGAVPVSLLSRGRGMRLSDSLLAFGNICLATGDRWIGKTGKQSGIHSSSLGSSSSSFELKHPQSFVSVLLLLLPFSPDIELRWTVVCQAHKPCSCEFEVGHQVVEGDFRRQGDCMLCSFARIGPACCSAGGFASGQLQSGGIPFLP